VVVQNQKTIVKRAHELSETDRKAWASLRAQNPYNYSPYFHLDYTLLISDLRQDVSHDRLSWLYRKGLQVCAS